MKTSLNIALRAAEQIRAAHKENDWSRALEVATQLDQYAAGFEPTSDEDPSERIACGDTHPDPETEARFRALRAGAGFEDDGTGCGGRGVWTFMFRCVECGRFFHRDCILKHFAAHAEGSENRALVEAAKS